MIDVVYFGTHENAASILQALSKVPDFRIISVITQPDRPVGKKQLLEPSPVKKMALSLGLSTLEPVTLKDFTPPKASLFVVCAYGLIIPQRILDIPTHGTINVHYSLLPKYRGASPYQTALINGETETGPTIMLMDAKLDHGPILKQEKTPIVPDDTAPTLAAKLNAQAIPMLITAMKELASGTATPQEQDHDQATFCKIFTRDDGKIDFGRSAREIYNQYRGLYPWPGIWTTWNGLRLKLLAIKPSTNAGIPGNVAEQNGIVTIGTTAGSLELIELQLEGKKAQSIKDFLNGNKTFVGSILG